MGWRDDLRLDMGKTSPLREGEDYELFTVIQAFDRNDKQVGESMLEIMMSQVLAKESNEINEEFWDNELVVEEWELLAQTNPDRRDEALRKAAEAKREAYETYDKRREEYVESLDYFIQTGRDVEFLLAPYVASLNKDGYLSKLSKFNLDDLDYDEQVYTRQTYEQANGYAQMSSADRAADRQADLSRKIEAKQRFEERSLSNNLKEVQRGVLPVKKEKSAKLIEIEERLAKNTQRALDMGMTKEELDRYIGYIDEALEERKVKKEVTERDRADVSSKRGFSMGE